MCIRDSFLYEGVPEDSTADRSADADDDYAVITLDLQMCIRDRS